MSKTDTNNNSLNWGLMPCCCHAPCVQHSSDIWESPPCIRSLQRNLWFGHKLRMFAKRMFCRLHHTGGSWFSEFETLHHARASKTSWSRAWAKWMLRTTRSAMQTISSVELLSRTQTANDWKPYVLLTSSHEWKLACRMRDTSPCTRLKTSLEWIMCTIYTGNSRRWGWLTPCCHAPCVQNSSDN